ncbi:hypothetical protein ACL02T_03415 [Pseudonocardia sp. RS010]|uniref:hypothetical protein n=1 Tax=Pseudonocardia sp. RS010 TaxID=3385979 RepID=UPI0039A27047
MAKQGTQGRRRTAARLGWAAAGAALVATGGTAAATLLTGTATAETPLTVTVTGAPAPLYTCDLQSPPEFGDPANPDTITNRACGYVDDQGRQRSFDPWIDGQLRDAAGS